MACKTNGCSNPFISKTSKCILCNLQFCTDTCLIHHFNQLHFDIQILPSQKLSVKSSFLKPGLMIKEALVDFDYFDFKNFVKLDKKLGTGAFGQVNQIRNKIDGKLFAVKELSKTRIGEFGMNPELIQREIRVHSRLVHPSIVRLYAFHEDEKAFYLILEYMSKGTLFNAIQNSRGLSEEKAFKYFIQIASAIQFLHDRDLVHRDLKPENCLIDQNDNIKLCDFGWAVQVCSKSRNTFCGTYEYMAPEIIQEDPYDHSIDVWSLGILLYEMIHGYSPFRVYIILFRQLFTKKAEMQLTK